jgi:RNA polymerase sigma-70 factor, ECF subfamily
LEERKLERISSWFESYSDDIYHYLVYYTGRKDVEDLVQEVFLKAMRGVTNFKGTSSPKTWLISIARNTAIDEARKQKMLRFVPFQDNSQTEEGKKLNPALISQVNDDYATLYEAISQLKKSYRDVILLRKISELSAKETAEVLNWKVDKVNLTLHRAMNALEKILALKNGGVEIEESMG